MTITSASMGGSHNYRPHDKKVEAPAEKPKVDLSELDGGLTLLQYQLAAHNTATYPEHGTGSLKALAYLMSLLASEAGEVNGKWGKFLRDGTASEELRQAIFLEMGDVLWSLAMLADEMDESLETVAKMNVDKLASRKERGVLGGSGDNR